MLDITGCQLMHVEGGLIREVRGHYSDQGRLDAFWEVPPDGPVRRRPPAAGC